MTRKQIQKAAKLFAYSMAANIDRGGSESENQDHVVDATNAWGLRNLARMGITSNYPATLQDCIEAASAAHKHTSA